MESPTLAIKLGNGVVDYYADAGGHGDWYIVNPCICFPVGFRFVFSEDLYADMRVNEQVSNQYGTTSRLDKWYGHGTSWDGGIITYGSSGLNIGYC